MAGFRFRLKWRAATGLKLSVSFNNLLLCLSFLSFPSTNHMTMSFQSTEGRHLPCSSKILHDLTPYFSQCLAVVPEFLFVPNHIYYCSSSMPSGVIQTLLFSIYSLLKKAVGGYQGNKLSSTVSQSRYSSTLTTRKCISIVNCSVGQQTMRLALWTAGSTSISLIKMKAVTSSVHACSYRV